MSLTQRIMCRNDAARLEKNQTGPSHTGVVAQKDGGHPDATTLT